MQKPFPSLTPELSHPPRESDGLHLGTAYAPARKPLVPVILQSERRRRKVVNIEVRNKDGTVCAKLGPLNSATAAMKRYEDMCTERAKGDADCQEPAQDASWWISRVLTLPPDRCTGGVLAQTLVETAKDHKIAALMHKSTFDKRMRQVGLGNF